MSEDEVLEKFIIRKNRQLVMNSISISIMLICLFAISYDFNLNFPIKLVSEIVLGLDVIGIIIFNITNFRCPRCKKYLGRESSPKYCKACGVRLQV